jgi:hypothetical protein
VTSERGLDARGIRAYDHHARLDLEGFERLEDPDREGLAAEVQQGLGGPHPG